MTGPFRRLPVVDCAAGAYALAFFVWLGVHTPGTPVATLVGQLAFLPLGLAVAWAYWRNATAVADRRTRLAWLGLAAGACCLWFSGNAWTIAEVPVNPNAWSWWVDWGEFAQHFFVLAAYLLFPNRQVDRHARPRFYADVALTLVAGAVLAFYATLRVALEEPSLAPWSITMLGVVLDWLVFSAATMALVQKQDATLRRVMLLLLGANVAYLLANVVYAHDPHYQVGNPEDGLWFLGWILRWSAARFAWLRTSGDRAVAAEPDAYQSGPVAYVMVATAFVLLISQIVAGDRTFLWLTATSVAAMVALLLFRQFVELQENRRLFAAQLAQEARFRSLVQQSSDVVLVVDGDGAISYVSPSAARTFGNAPLAPGAQLRDVIEDATALAPVYEQPSAPRPLPCRMRTATGGWREVELTWSDLRRDPTVQGIVFNCRDVTERNELERHLRHAQRLDAVGHLAGGLAHDFNNLLTVIRGYTELLRQDLPASALSSQQDLTHMEQAVDRAAAVTRKLLAFSQRQNVQAAVLDVNAVIRDLQPLFRQLLPDRVEVVLDLRAELWPVKADQGQLEQVLVNLATNARDAMPEGGQLRIETGNRQLPVPASPGAPAGGDYACITVRDTGVGMSEEVRARIFDPFFSTKPKDRGMGLGLAMVHGIVHGADGHILVDTTPGRGTAFVILLPRTTEAAGAGAPAASAAAAPPRTRTVLLVDDETGVRTIVRRLLERHGYKVVEAADGAAAMRLVEQDTLHLDLLLTDMVMPGMHGRELIAKFRARRPGVPVVSMSGFTGEGGAADPGSTVVTLAKPFTSDALIRAVAATDRTR